MKKLTIQFLGTGNGLENDLGTYHSNLIVSYGEDRLFIDCGADFPHALKAAGLSYKDIEHLYISHIHSDHAGGLEWLGFYNHFYPGKKPLRLYGVADVIYTLEDMFMPSMSPSIPSMAANGFDACFKVKIVKRFFRIGEMTCRVIKTLHVSAYGKLYSYGLLIHAGNKSVLITTDTQFNPKLFMKYYEQADLIFHDCTTNGEVVKKAAHAHIQQLATLPAEIKEKMYLYHCGPSPRPDAMQYGFKGYIKQNRPVTA